MVSKAICIVIALAVILTGCTTTPSSPSTPVAPTKPAVSGPSGTLTVATSSLGNENLDPVTGGTVSQALHQPMFETFVWWGESGNVVPRLAESWSISDDGKSWTFKLRKGVKFHNGDEMISADAKWSLERLISPASRSSYAANYRATVDRIEAPDPYTLVVHTKDFNANFAVSTVGLFVLPKKYFEEKGEAQFAKSPVGTGPFKFVKQEPGQSLEYEAVNNHWRITPGFQRVIVKLVPEESTRIAMLKRGEIDVTEISLDNADDLKKAGYEFRYGSFDTQAGVWFSGTWIDSGSPSYDVRVRQALSLAINREELAQSFFKGFGKPSVRMSVGSYSWGYDQSWKPDPYDPQKAKQLLAEAGYPGKFKDPVVNLWSAQYPGAGWLPEFVQIISGYWEAVGVKTKITPIDYAKMMSMVGAKPIDPKAPGWVRPMAGFTQPNSLLLINSAYGTAGPAGSMSDPAWDALYANTLKERDDNKRVTMFRELLNKAHDKYVEIETVNLKLVYAVSNKVGEWRAIATTSGSVYEGVQRK